MESGDISNSVAPRILFVFEGLIATVQSDAKYKLFVKTGAWHRAMEQWQPNEHVQKMMWDITARYSYSCDVVSYLPAKARPALKDWLEDRGYPYGTLSLTTVETMTRTVTNNPSVYFVYDAEPRRSLAYGSKTVYVPDPNKLGFA